MMYRSSIFIAAAFAAAPLMAQIYQYPTYEPSKSVKQGYTAEDLRDTEVLGKNGEQIGEIEDLIIGPDAQLRRLVVSVNEGFLGTGGRRLAIDWSEVDVNKTDHDIKSVTVPVTKQNVEEFGLFEDKQKSVKGGPREWRATELLGDYISLEDVNDYGSVTDLMFDRQGQLQAIAASPDIDSPLIRFYAPYVGEGWEPGAEYYVLPYSEKELNKILPEDATQGRASGSR